MAVRTARAQLTVGRLADGYSKSVGFLEWDYTVAVTIRVVNAGASGVVEVMAIVGWQGGPKTKSQKAFMEADEERTFLFEFEEVGSGDEWTWSADARVVK